MNTGLDSLKATTKQVVHKPGEFLGNKIADTVTKLNDDKNVKKKPVKGIIIPPEKKEGILNELRQEL